MIRVANMRKSLLLGCQVCKSLLGIIHFYLCGWSLHVCRNYNLKYLLCLMHLMPNGYEPSTDLKVFSESPCSKENSTYKLFKGLL